MRSTSRRGFTLAEGLIASTVLAVAVAGVAAPLMAAAKQASAAQETATATALARQLLEETAARPFPDPATLATRTTLPTGATRSQFRDLSDYRGYADSTPRLATMSGGSAGVTAAGVFRRAVTVEYRTTYAGGSATSGDYALVTVTVTPPAGPVVSAARVVTRWARIVS